jgi:L-asparaginase
MKPIKFLLTGGTIDKVYAESKGSLTYIESMIPKLLDQSRHSIPYSIDHIMSKDSLDMNFADRVFIRDYCKRSLEECIIVIHGTDTMIETARALETIKSKTIIMTGAIIPASVNGSDALFNLGTAIAYSQSLPIGVYIAMNGIAFPCENTKKNVITQKFENIYLQHE